MPKKTPKPPVRKSKKLLFSTVIAFVSAIILILILIPPAQHNSSLSGVDVLHDCQSELSIFVSLQPFVENKNDVLAGISILDWNKVSDTCKTFKVIFPGVTSNQVYIVDSEPLINAGVDISQPFAIAYTRRLLPADSTVHDPYLNQDIISINSSELDEFGGMIQFLWHNGVEKTDFGTYRLFLPFQATQSAESQTQNSRNFDVSLVVTSGMELISHVPEASRFKSTGDMVFYNFQVDAQKTQLMLNFEDPNLRKWKDFLLIALAAVFGVGITWVFEEIKKVYEEKKAG
ncbi:MAG: hypothetical protein IPL71_21765 [Anaerolineales bacterium]|uniref:hypothetical protein n=1 Tax=Candidatus Villigracilis proximus TaxID=3140683 RepID=UPI0031366A39|nr:hypothetical protein [Anaerolineales bacterium]